MFQCLKPKLENEFHPLLGPTLWGLQAWGMWQPKKRLLSITYNFIHILAILFVFSQYVELWYIRSNLEMAMRNLSVSMLSTICVVKASTFVLWQKYWNAVIEYVSSTEKKQLAKKDSETNKIIYDYTKYSRNVTYLYWALTSATVFTVILAPLGSFLSSSGYRSSIRNESLSYPEIMSSWAPFDKSKGQGYWAMVIEHILICFYGGGIVANYDSNAVVVMSFFAGQLEILKSNCSRIFGNGDLNLSYQEIISRIRNCHEHHVNIVKFSKMLDSLLSPVMFLYIIICSLMICASAVQLNMKGTTTMQRIWIAEYLLALIAQLFLYCWHSNRVLYMSLKVDEGVYACAWWSQGVRVRRSILLLGGQLKKYIVFTAGPFTKLTVATFVTILKGSYSYYTILSKREN